MLKRAEQKNKYCKNVMSKKPVKKTPELLTKICQLITEGKSVRSISKLKDMPTVQAIMKWLNNDEEFNKMYQQARQNQGDLYGEMINDICLELLTGQRTDFQNCRVAIDGLKWTVSKMNSKWSDRQIVDVNQTNYVDELTKVQSEIQRRMLEKGKGNQGLEVIEGAKPHKPFSTTHEEKKEKSIKSNT